MLRERANDDRTSTEKLTPPPMPNPDEVNDALNQWAGVNLSGRIQVLLDVSGSMGDPVPGTDKTRIGLVLEAAKLGIGLMKPTTKIGVWRYSTDLDGPGKDYKELIPIRPVAEQLSNGAIDTLLATEAVSNGGTGLYDSVLAAYKSATQNYEAGRINLIVVLTDGGNDNDSGGIDREQLLDELGKLRDPKHPVQIIGIGIGSDIDGPELNTIAKATGGQAFTTPDPAKIGDVFYTALSKLACQPPTCQPPSGG
jgi:hypothetical protein